MPEEDLIDLSDGGEDDAPELVEAAEQLPQEQGNADDWSSSSDDDSGFVEVSASGAFFDNNIPPLFTSPPTLTDKEPPTQSSELQQQTEDVCLPLLRNPSGLPANTHGIPSLLRDAHSTFLKSWLEELPSGFVSMDAARPWIVYWCLSGLGMLGHDLSVYRDAAIETFAQCQHPDGGFGGGFGQLAHLAPSYAAVLSLVMVGGEEAYELMDRRKMWRWIGQMKQRDGGFTMCFGGEEDCRGAMCALMILSILDLPMELPDEVPAK
ncbi:hypothetical protein LTS18_013020, partial [Coniosporium uncinatum]